MLAGISDAEMVCLTSCWACDKGEGFSANGFEVLTVEMEDGSSPWRVGVSDVAFKMMEMDGDRICTRLDS